MILSPSIEAAKEQILGKITREGRICRSRFGNYISSNPTMIVVENPEFSRFRDFDYDVCGERYSERLQLCIDSAAAKLKASPFTRRVSIPLWRPKDHFCKTPAAITELSFLLVDGKLHLTAYIRSLDCLNYFEHNFDFMLAALEKLCKATGYDAGSVAALVGIPHIYERDFDRAKRISAEPSEVYGYTDLATHIVDDYISSAWHTALDIIYTRGRRKRTEWGEVFEGQEESLFVHRMLIEVRKPEENKIHDKAPFTERYGIEYAHDYVIYAARLDGKVSHPILKEGEEYTYAERARYCEKDETKVDQLYEVIEKLRKDPCRRDCYVGISRPWDIESDEPPCLRGYHFVKRDELYGIFYMRSNDAYGAMHANMYAFALLTRYVAELTGFDRYKYIHFALDAHIYGEFVKAVKDILFPDSPSYSDFIG